MENDVDPYEVPGLIEAITATLKSDMWDGPFIPDVDDSEVPF